MQPCQLLACRVLRDKLLLMTIRRSGVKVIVKQPWTCPAETTAARKPSASGWGTCPVLPCSPAWLLMVGAVSSAF